MIIKTQRPTQKKETTYSIIPANCYTQVINFRKERILQSFMTLESYLKQSHTLSELRKSPGLTWGLGLYDPMKFLNMKCSEVGLNLEGATLKSEMAPVCVLHLADKRIKNSLYSNKAAGDSDHTLERSQTSTCHMSMDHRRYGMGNVLLQGTCNLQVQSSTVGPSWLTFHGCSPFDPF